MIHSGRNTFAWAMAILLLGAACAEAPDKSSALEDTPPAPQDLGIAAEEQWEGDPQAALRTRPVIGTNSDWKIAQEHIAWIRRLDLDTLSYFGDVVGALGERFIGTPYAPNTLDVPGAERLVINLEALDCVTFVENVLALARVVRAGEDILLGDLDRFRPAFEAELIKIRYRDGKIDGFPSRLHYFSDWIRDNAAMGLVANVGEELGGVSIEPTVNFMSTHVAAYSQLSSANDLSQIEEIEASLSGAKLFFIPQEEIEEKAHRIRNGDIIAATSTTEGLDIAHTGIALWREGRLRLLHAPLVGDMVQLSEESLAERILRISGQDGIMVARPADPGSVRRPNREAARRPPG